MPDYNDDPSPPHQEGGGFFDGALHLVEEAVAVGQAAGHVAYDAASTAYTAAGATVTTVVDTAAAAASTVAAGVGSAASAATAPMLNSETTKRAARPLVRAANTMVNRYKKAVSPVVLGQGNDFAQALAPGQEAVVLRIEIASSAEVKAMRWLAWIISAFSFAATVS